MTKGFKSKKGEKYVLQREEKIDLMFEMLSTLVELKHPVEFDDLKKEWNRK
jgi:hypothetical protein